MSNSWLQAGRLSAPSRVQIVAISIRALGRIGQWRGAKCCYIYPLCVVTNPPSQSHQFFLKAKSLKVTVNVSAELIIRG